MLAGRRRRWLSHWPLLQFMNRASTSSNSFPFSTVSEQTQSGACSKSLSRKAISAILISLTGGVALSALDDLAIYQGCSNKAMERASQDQRIVEALGEPIEKGPWYNATLAVAHKRQSVSCTFPVSGPRGTGVFQMRAISHRDDTWFSFLRHRDWDVLIMDALLHVPTNEDKLQTLRISLSDNMPPAVTECKECQPQKTSGESHI